MLVTPPAGVAMPVIKTLSDCASYSKTVEPYIPQLYALPEKVLANIGDLEGLKDVYTSTNPIISGLAFSLALFPIFLITSEINRNWSQVDRVWSILPTIYHIHYAVWARMNGLETQKVDNVMAFSVVWSIRLTFNYWRRGGYQIGSEDYRWNLVKARIGAPAFFLLNVLFTSSVQSVLLFAVTTPTYILLLSSRIDPAMSTVEVSICRALITLVAVEFIADQQQWNFHQAKAAYQRTARPQHGYSRAQLDRGFNTTGLWKFSRHPNFAAEQAIWVGVYILGAYSTGSWFNWTAAGVIIYLSVFAGSTPLTESISAGKYPEYKLYQQRVGRFLPSILGNYWKEDGEISMKSKIEAEAAKRADKRE
ncbi:hypothetical protein Q7P37_004697 [Cladosporium fusiforme]